MGGEESAWSCGECHNYVDYCLECGRPRERYDILGESPARYSPPVFVQAQVRDQEHLSVPEIRINPVYQHSFQDTTDHSGGHIAQTSPSSLPLATYVNSDGPWNPLKAATAGPFMTFRLGDPPNAGTVSHKPKRRFSDQEKADMNRLKKEGGACSVCKRKKQKCSFYCPTRLSEFGGVIEEGSADGTSASPSRHRNSAPSSDIGHDERKANRRQRKLKCMSPQLLTANQNAVERHPRRSPRDSSSRPIDTRSDPGFQQLAQDLPGRSSLNVPSYEAQSRYRSPNTLSEQLNFQSYNPGGSFAHGLNSTDLSSFDRDLQNLPQSSPYPDQSSTGNGTDPAQGLGWTFDPADSLPNSIYPNQQYFSNTMPSCGYADGMNFAPSHHSSQPVASSANSANYPTPPAILNLQYRDPSEWSYRSQVAPTGNSHGFSTEYPSGNTSASNPSFSNNYPEETSSSCSHKAYQT